MVKLNSDAEPIDRRDPPVGLDEHPAKDFAVNMTKRELFAARALQGMCADPNTGDLKPSQMAAAAVLYADALLEELKK